MPSSAVRTFTDPDDYAASLRASHLELAITASGPFTGKITRIDLRRLWMQRFSESLPQIGHSSIIPGRAVVSFWTRPGPDQLWNGLETQPTNIVRHSEGEHFYRRSSASSYRAAMSLPIEDLTSVASAMIGSELTPPRYPMLITPPPAAMATLQRLHAAAGHLAEQAPEIIANPDAARGLEQALIEAMVECLDNRDHRGRSLAQGQHAVVMRRFRRVIEENPEQPLYIPEICKAIRVSERTLRTCCEEHLGMGPKRYLLLRRMHFARRALRRATPGGATVTEIATRFGFWQLGRFAVEYQSLFGETPSATLRRQAG
jgi:AraC-like DNA-binding protein